MSKLNRLRKKRRYRVAKRKHSYERMRHHEKRSKELAKEGRPVRSNWHLARREIYLRRYIKQRKAVRKLTRLIEKEVKRLSRLNRPDWNGHPPVSENKKLVEMLVYVEQAVPEVYVTATTDGTHSPTSWHYRRNAFDLGSDDFTDNPEGQAQLALYKKYGAAAFAELFGPLGWYIKDGIRYEGPSPDNPNHLHVAPRQ